MLLEYSNALESVKKKKKTNVSSSLEVMYIA